MFVLSTAGRKDQLGQHPVEKMTEKTDKKVSKKSF